jgi:hypothetical protein
MLYLLLESLSQFEAYDSRVAFVHPANVLLNPQGQLKLVNKYSLPISYFTRLRRYSQPGPDKAATFSDCFSIGLTVLQAGALSARYLDTAPLEACAELLRAMAEAEKKQGGLCYSPFLMYTVRRMVKPDKRPSTG